MKISGQICAKALNKVLKEVSANVTCLHLDKIARQELQSMGASSSFMTVEDYRWTICTTINHQVVHGIPGPTKLEEGDILGIDIGAIYQGFHSDMALTVPIGNVSPKTQHFLDVGEKTLNAAISKAKVGNRIGDISSTIQEMIEQAGYSAVRSLTGHGIGRQLHEEPMVPCFGEARTGPKILEGMTLAIEVIYSQGKGDVFMEKDGWTISTQDGSLGGLFEKTVAVAKEGPIVLTPYL